jgi:integrase
MEVHPPLHPPHGFIVALKVTRFKILFAIRPSTWHCFTDQQGITGKKSFYSFRRSFVEYLKSAKVDTHLISALIGHADNSITTGRYSSGEWDLDQLSEVFNKIPAHTVI